MFAALENLRDALAAIAGVQSCRIGVEANISPADYPLIRLVPQTMKPAEYRRRSCTLIVYFGAALADSEGLEAVYDALLSLEAEIITVMQKQGAAWLDTWTDEDRLETYKLMRSRFLFEAARPVPT